MSRPRTITVIGSLNTDLVTVTPRIPSGGETLTATSFSTGFGGKGANQATGCVRTSRPNTRQAPDDPIVKMVGAVGEDEFGPPLVASMKADSIDTSGIRVVKGQTTGVAVILVEEGTGENRIMLNPGANHSLRPDDFLTPESLGSPLPDLIIMQLEIPLETVLQILETAKKADVAVLLNPAPALKLPKEVYTAITHLIVNESELAILSGIKKEDVGTEGFELETLAEDFFNAGLKNFVVTLGSKGAWYRSASGEMGLVQAEKVAKVVDTTAAGDTFVGAYAMMVVKKQGNSVDEKIVQVACKYAGKTVEKKGAQSAIPWASG
jgi:ribokinase